MHQLTTKQRTPEWFAARAGRVTASEIWRVRSGLRTKSRLDYIERLVLDLEGVENFNEEEPYFFKGRYYEDFALGWYEWHREVDVTRYGFCVHDTLHWLGCSPDGGVGTQGGVEIKFREFLRTFKAAITGDPAPREYAQLQAQCWVMGWDWVDYLNYWRDDEREVEQGHVRRIPRDQAYIDSELYGRACEFWAAVMETYKRRNGRKPFAINLEVAA